MLSILNAIILVTLMVYISGRPKHSDLFIPVEAMRYKKGYRGSILLMGYFYPLMPFPYPDLFDHPKGIGLGLWYFALFMPALYYYTFVSRFYIMVTDQEIIWKKFNTIHQVKYSEIAHIKTNFNVDHAKYVTLNIFCTNGVSLKLTQDGLEDTNALVNKILKYSKPSNVKIRVRTVRDDPT